MKNYIKPYFLVLIIAVFLACEKEEPIKMNSLNTLTIKNKIPISTNFIGNGAQWGGFEQIESWTGKDDFSEADWTKLKERIDFMRPPFIRIMISSGWYYLDQNQNFYPQKTTKAFHRMMKYCTDNNITVMFGEWGHEFVNGDRNQINSKWMNLTVEYLDYLINDKGYSCIKFYNMVNEPNGDWSSTNGNYNLWKKVTSEFLVKLNAKGLNQKVKLAGPDIAFFGDSNATDWLTKSEADFGEQMSLYDIHSYPTKSFINGDNYMGVLKAFKNAIPAHKQIIMGEIGVKLYGADMNLQMENENRIKADQFSGIDSNMFIYDGVYGVDISEAIIQTMMAGYSGALVWNMDDAQYNMSGLNYGTEYKKLKRWGFWNILGEEAFGGITDEKIRPFFYPISLLCRYFPKGSDIIEVELPNKKGLRAVAARKGSSYTIAIVNSNFVTYSNISLKAEDIFSFDNVSKFEYKSNYDGGYQGKTDSKGLPIPLEKEISIKLDGSFSIDVPGQSVIIFTNIQ